MTLRSLSTIFFLLATAVAFPQDLKFLNHNKSLFDAHNCYPYEGKFADRIERALKTGTPVAIEQDLAWHVDKATGKGSVVVSHTEEATGAEPTLRQHFFERVRPMMDAALKANNRSTWPLIVLHFDFKGKDEALYRAVWDMLGEYEGWITTAVNGNIPSKLQPFDAKPLLVLTEESDAQEAVFFTKVPSGQKLRIFGSAHTKKIEAPTREERARLAVSMPPEALLAERPTNYRRWWNNPWAIVEEGGQTRAGDWTAADNKRLKSLVDHAHKLGFWIRFYTLDGFAPEESQGWDKNYNFGSKEAVKARWKAVIDAGVDLVAVDQYEDFSAFLKAHR